MSDDTDDSDVTEADCRAASDEMGYDVDADRVEEALANQGSLSLAEAQESLIRAEADFERAGGRGVELAEEIDDLRIIIAVASIPDEI